MVELRVRRNAVVISDAEALNGGIVVVPKDIFSAGRLDVVEGDGRAVVVWRRMRGHSDVALLEFDGASKERVEGLAREVVPELAALLADKVLRAEDGRRNGGTGGWKMAAVASWVVIAALGGVLGGAAAMGGEQAWSKLGTMAAAKVWPSTCSTPSEGVGGAAETALSGKDPTGVRGPIAERPVSGGAVLPEVVGNGVASSGRWGGSIGIAGPDDVRRRMDAAEQAVQAQAQRLSREQAERTGDGDGVAVGSAAATGAGGSTVRTGVFVPLAD